VKQPENTVHLISISRIRAKKGCEISEITLRGVVRETTEESFRSYLAQAGERSPLLLVNFAELDYINSTGLGILLEQSRSQEQRGGWLRIVSPSQTAAMILNLSGVADVLRVSETVDTVLEDLSRAA